MPAPGHPTEAVLRRAVCPPLRSARFWVVQAAVVAVAVVHLLVDAKLSVQMGAFPAGIPVALLVVPVGYAALRFGLAGSAATGLGATLLWLPDLLLPPDQGHLGGDLVDLAVIDLVALVVGWRIDSERLAHARAERATAARLAAEVRYRQLFEANRAPILVLDEHGRVREANGAARELFGTGLAGRPATEVLGSGADLAHLAGAGLRLQDGRDYRAEVMPLPADTDPPATQIVLHDVTAERSEGRRAIRYAALVVQAEEDQRRRLARELHDEPLQLFVHLARQLDSLGAVAGVPPAVTAGLGAARQQALAAAGRLRSLARDLRPPALDQLGLVAALSSLVADVEESVGLAARLCVAGEPVRLPPDTELGAYRIVQEAVRNTARHAAATRLWVTVDWTGPGLHLTVTDDGRGFEPTTATDTASRGHLGLLGMRERAELLGGRLDVHSEPGTGTTVSATIPVGAPRMPEPQARTAAW